MMKKILFTVFIGSSLVITSCETLKQLATVAVVKELTNDDIANGLKMALELGIGKGSEQLSQKGGYFNSPYKILLPEEARKVSDRLRVIPGFDKLEERMIEKLNEGAEDAATKAKPIFINAIKSMTFSDAMGILMGEKSAATNFLRRTTSEALYKEFNPVIVESLDKFGARKLWSDAITAYNKIPLVKKANPSLDDYVTNEALKGLFSMVEDKEKSIRTNRLERTNDLLRRVFAKQDTVQ